MNDLFNQFASAFGKKEELSPADAFLAKKNKELEERQQAELDALEFPEETVSAMQPSKEFDDVELYMSGHKDREDIVKEQLIESGLAVEIEPFGLMFRVVGHENRFVHFENEISHKFFRHNDKIYYMHDAESTEPDYSSMPQGLKEAQQRNGVRDHGLTGVFEKTDDNKVKFVEKPNGTVYVYDPNKITPQIKSVIDRKFPDADYVGTGDKVLYRAGIDPVSTDEQADLFEKQPEATTELNLLDLSKVYDSNAVQLHDGKIPLICANTNEEALVYDGNGVLSFEGRVIYSETLKEKSPEEVYGESKEIKPIIDSQIVIEKPILTAEIPINYQFLSPEKHEPTIETIASESKEFNFYKPEQTSKFDHIHREHSTGALPTGNPHQIKIVILGEPTAQKRHKGRNMGGFVQQYDPSAADKADFLSLIHSNAPAVPFDCPLRVDCFFYFTRPQSHYGTGKNAGVLKSSAPTWKISKPDRDNLDKFVMDSMNKIYWRDDSIVCAGEILKRYDVSPRTEITITVL